MNSASVLVPVLALFAVVACISAAPSVPRSGSESPEVLLQQVRDIVPEEVINAFMLTEDEKAVLADMTSGRLTFETEEQAIEALNERSPQLYQKLLPIFTVFKEKIESLSPEAKSFVFGLVDKVQDLKPNRGEKPNKKKIIDVVFKIIEQYKALSDEAKENLKASFPIVTRVIQNEKFQMLVQIFLKKDDAPGPIGLMQDA
ncbi:nematode fatty acid retinoid binding protein (Gp-FAR-1) domain-containing protein [Ditylenchus destructor]|nr:nematode fatty acid retinoid binding protein (Gp-FAR-1) domain-containing protein [Ditylenchus destructor]